MIINSVETTTTKGTLKEATENLASKKLGSFDRKEIKEKIDNAKELLLSQNPVVKIITEAVKKAVEKLPEKAASAIITVILKETVTNVPQKIEQMAPPETDSGTRYKQPDSQ